MVIVWDIHGKGNVNNNNESRNKTSFHNFKLNLKLNGKGFNLNLVDFIVNYGLILLYRGSQAHISSVF